MGDQAAAEQGARASLSAGRAADEVRSAAIAELDSAPVRPRGELTHLRAGDYTAAVSSVGAMLDSLQIGGRDLVLTSPEDSPMLFHRGAIIAPWPNRIGDGEYVWDGEQIRVPINEPERSNALHGLVSFLPFTVVEQTEDAATFICLLAASPAYPFTLRLMVEHRLDAEEGLSTVVTALNIGDRDAPYGVCPHPYVLAGPEPLDEWTLHVPAEELLVVDPERLLPQGLRPLESGEELDFRAPRRIGALGIDHAYTRVYGPVRVTAPGGTGVEVRADSACPWVQVHTGDRPEPEHDRKGLAVEPMTCPPDAFRTGVDLVRLAPGQIHRAGWSIRGW